MTAEIFEGIPFDNILKCVHCGLCLDACPTYRVLGTEQDSPRGRLYLMRGLWEGELAVENAVIEPLARCLDCRACESACPSLVPYGELLEKTRGALAKSPHRKSLSDRFRAWLFRWLFPSTRRLTRVSAIGRWAQKTGLASLASRTLPRLARVHALTPRFSGRSFKQAHPKPLPPFGEGAPKRTVALFSGCVMDVADDEIHRATVALLRAVGCAVRIPTAQRCCGALHVHNGDRATARALANLNEQVFSSMELDAVIVNAAGCGAQLKEYGHLFSDTMDPQTERWREFGLKTTDILVFLAECEGFPESLAWRSEPVTVLYDAPCHLIHAQKIDFQARNLLGRIPGVTLAPLKDAAQCCGAAGVYNLTHAALADEILDRKLDDIAASLTHAPRTTILLTGNPGCLFQLRMGVGKRRLPIKVMHPAAFLAERLLNNDD